MKSYSFLSIFLFCTCVSSYRGQAHTYTNSYTYLFAKGNKLYFTFLVFLFFLGLACAENWLRDRQEAPNKRTETVRRRVTDLTASTPFAKPPVCKKKRKRKDQLGHPITSN
jgi:hypothetical protein